MRILVVDDCPDTVDIITTLLETLGHSCRGAQTAADAIEEARAFAPELVLLDLVLPDMSGVDVAIELRKQAQRRRFYMAALTGLGMASDRSRTQAAGFDQHLVKPITVSALREMVGRAALFVIDDAGARDDKHGRRLERH